MNKEELQNAIADVHSSAVLVTVHPAQEVLPDGKTLNLEKGEVLPIQTQPDEAFKMFMRMDEWADALASSATESGGSIDE